MNQETIERHINSLGKIDFDAVVFLIMKKVFNLTPIDIDGKGDGGIDFRFFENDYKKKIGCQKSIQKDQWQTKAFNDAKKAKENYPITQFYFFTNHAHEPIEIHIVEERILNEFDIFAHCYGATEIAGYIISHNLISDFAHAINLDIDVRQRHQIDKREVLLHTYFALSSDRKDLQNEIFENTLILQLFENGSMTRNDLVGKSIHFLSLSDTELTLLDKRVDSILMSGKIQKKGNYLSLSNEMQKEISIAACFYDKDVELLASICGDIITKDGGEWTNKNSKEIAILLAKCYVERQITSAKNSSLQLSMTGLMSQLDNPEEKIKALLLKLGISKNDINNTFARIIEVANGNSLIQKLASSVVYVCLRQIPTYKSVAVLNTNNWQNVKVYLDSSVAIPYITSALFGPSQERFSKGSNSTIKIFSKLGTKLVIPYVYLNECASHLLAAKDYCVDFHDWDEPFSYSVNGYVSHYFQLKRMNLKAPNTLREYIELLSPSVFKPMADRYTQIGLIMQELQERFNDYDISWEKYSFKEIEQFRKSFEIGYSYILSDSNTDKSPTQVEHDVNVLAFLKQQSLCSSDRIIMLTWDKTLIRFAREDENVAWVINPVEAADLVQSRTSFSMGTLMSLGHSLARVMTKKQEAAGHIIDKIIFISKGNFADYEYLQKILEIKRQAFAILDQQSPDFNVTDFERETVRLFADNGLNIKDIQEKDMVLVNE